ncbi:efflux RND transporter periplasmic adaptor subunit [Thalassospira lucentensis]|uniref:efflux RND transporter periplasmic adaptor subunit n=1 Tax=Thalassospira lucentensis TaxID=168935 RepID=UPI0003B608AE|nr:efflux RND transporter periplasmic adaptor subunit [Thalassospira lucentensis]RCK30002.1 hypothetical protein TH1_04085 [Thalassospira lucentensis MCCC 1A00383 = DSM 14000]
MAEETAKEVSTGRTEATQTRLPELRDDLKLLKGPTDVAGIPTWTIHDPVRNRFHRITSDAHDLLSFWHLATPDAVARAVEKSTGKRPADASIDWLVHFLRTNFLVRQQTAEGVKGLSRIAGAGKGRFIRRLLGQYLFFRVPLIRPQKFLDATCGFADLLCSRTIRVLIILMGIVGVFLVTRQWDTFSATFLHFFSWEGVVWYGLALIFTKILHEFGHAYAATRAGCRVPTMGVAFLVMWPVLYTDTSDAWRLVSRRKRFGIGAAGIVTELCLASIATFLWSFLPEGPAKSAAFLVATVTWVLTLVINLNPFMRFDGYYLLSDALGFENLQDRSFARAKWWLRETLFGFGEAPPEPAGRQFGIFLIAYAIAVWLYRLILFAGIALLVYGFFFKVLGIFLFVAEIILLIGMPIWRELCEIVKRRSQMQWNRRLMASVCGSLAVLALLCLPWNTNINLPAYLQAGERSVVFAPEAASLQSLAVRRGDIVKVGDELLTLKAEELDFSIQKTKLSIAMRKELIRREAAGGQERTRINILRQDMESDLARLVSYEEQRQKMTIRARFAGKVVELDENLRSGMSVSKEKPLITIVDQHMDQVVGYVNEDRLEEIQAGMSATFYPDDYAQPSLSLMVKVVSPVNSSYLEAPFLASIYGGKVAVEQDQDKRLVPIESVYRVVFEVIDAQSSKDRIERGIVKLKGEGKSIAGAFLRKATGVLLREGNF